MKKIPFYHPASPSFFHIAVLLIYGMFVLFLKSPSSDWLDQEFIVFLAIFNILFILSILALPFLLRRIYQKTYQTLELEKITKTMMHDYRIIISFIFIPYLTMFILGLSMAGTYALGFIGGILPFFGFIFIYLYLLPKLIQLILLKK